MHVHVDMEQISLSSFGGRKTGMHISLVSEDEFPGIFFFSHLCFVCNTHKAFVNNLKYILESDFGVSKSELH